MKITKIVVCVLCIILYNCTTFKKSSKLGVISLEDGRKVVMNDIAANYKTSNKHLKKYGKSFDVFNFYSDSIVGDDYMFHIVPNYNNVTLRVEDKVGEIPDLGFPNRYYEVNDKLFLWEDKTTPMDQAILNMLNHYGILDSVAVKKELNLLPADFEDNRVFIIDHSVKGYFYFVSKNDSRKYKKVPSSKIEKYLHKISSQSNVKEKEIK